MGEHKKLGDLLLDHGDITGLQLAVALATQKSSKRRLGSIIVERGFATEEQIASCLAEQYGFPLASLDTIQPEPAALGRLSAEAAVSLCALPISVSGGMLTVAIADPIDVHASDEIQRIAGLRLAVRIAPAAALDASIRKWYGLDHAAIPESANANADELPERFANATLWHNAGGTFAYTARDRALDRAVSLIGIPRTSGSHDQIVALALRLAKSENPAVASVHDLLTTESASWVVLDRLHGETLSNVLETRGPRSVTTAAEIVGAIASGVDSLNLAGACGAIVSTENIVVRRDGSCFLAPLAYPKPIYFSPDEKCDTSEADVFSLGVLLLECVTGNAQTSPNVSGIAGLPQAMEGLIARCLHPERDKRFSSALHVQLALKSVDWSRLPIESGTSQGQAVATDREALLRSVTGTEAEVARPGFFQKLFGGRAA